jgi:glyceraldehyde 3-phosphate dehydrogenase
MIRVAINGFGRIGRLSFRAMLNSDNIEVVAINDITDNATLAHLLKHDTAYRAFPCTVKADDTHIVVNGKKIPSLMQRDPASLPWKDLDVDVVLECTGVFRDKEGASKHLTAGAKRVIISAPGKGDGIACFVRGINCDAYADEDVIDNASCTTNCTAPVMQVLDESFGVEKAFMTTIHSYTMDQHLQDAPHKDLRRARAAAQNIIPTSTGAAIATTKVVPSLDGKFDGMAIRVPTLTVSIIDVVALLGSQTTAEDVNAAFRSAADGSLKGLLGVTDEPLVSSDFIGDEHSAVVDLSLTNVVDGNLVKVIAWYDNEWGYAHRLVEMLGKVGASLHK